MRFIIGLLGIVCIVVALWLFRKPKETKLKKLELDEVFFDDIDDGAKLDPKWAGGNPASQTVTQLKKLP